MLGGRSQVRIRGGRVPVQDNFPCSDPSQTRGSWGWGGRVRHGTPGSTGLAEGHQVRLTGLGVQ